MKTKRKIKAVLKREDILEAARIGDIFSCPVARAVNRELPAGWSCAVGMRETDIHNEDGYVCTFTNPPEIQRFINVFDGYDYEDRTPLVEKHAGREIHLEVEKEILGRGQEAVPEEVKR